MNDILSIYSSFFTLIIVLFSIILHEVAHGYAAYLEGDETAYRAGRLTLNPLPHIDLIGSVIVPLFAFFTAGTFFGWAKPVPYNAYNIRSKYGVAFVASAGVLTNLFIAFISGVFFKLIMFFGFMNNGIETALYTIIGVNVSLAFFNLLPIPPFDGMSIIQALFPRLAIKSRFIYNPVYMIGAIVVASVLYGMLIPYVFLVIQKILL